MIAERFRQTVSGSTDGVPPWAAELTSGSDEGLFGPNSAVWEVHGSVSTVVGGIRALLLQAAHPAALAGVMDHSRYQSDLLGRLAGTTRWLVVTTFGSTEAVAREAARVNAMHAKVTGHYADREGESRGYAARDPRFLLWVHCAFTDSFLKAHLGVRFPLTRGADRYVREWSASAVPLGLTGTPASVADLERVMQDFRDRDLTATDETRRVVGLILNPPFGLAARLFYRVIANAAIATLNNQDRELLGLARRSRAWLALAHMALRGLRYFLGVQSPSEQLARRRIEGLRTDQGTGQRAQGQGRSEERSSKVT